jgi:hypothetical protein
MVSQHPNPDPDRMTMRLKPSVRAGGSQVPVSSSAVLPPGSTLKVPATSFNIEIPAPDGTILLRMFERDGMLCVTGDETRWDEGAKRFIHGMLQWSGQAPIRWKDEARKTAEG